METSGTGPKRGLALALSILVVLLIAVYHIAQ